MRGEPLERRRGQERLRKRKQRLTESFLIVDMAAVALSWMAAYYARFNSTLVTTPFPPYKGVPEVRDYAQLLPLILGIAAAIGSVPGFQPPPSLPHRLEFDGRVEARKLVVAR